MNVRNYCHILHLLIWPSSFIARAAIADAQINKEKYLLTNVDPEPSWKQRTLVSRSHKQRKEGEGVGWLENLRFIITSYDRGNTIECLDCPNYAFCYSLVSKRKSFLNKLDKNLFIFSIDVIVFTYTPHSSYFYKLNGVEQALHYSTNLYKLSGVKHQAQHYSTMIMLYERRASNMRVRT